MNPPISSLESIRERVHNIWSPYIKVRQCSNRIKCNVFKHTLSVLFLYQKLNRMNSKCFFALKKDALSKLYLKRGLLI